MRRLGLAIEALVLLVVASAVRRLVPLRWIDGVLGRRVALDAPVAPDGAPAALDVRWALAAAARRLPWTPSCVPQALAASVMLRRRGVPYRVTIGVRSVAALEAHAWVEAGSVVVAGARVAGDFAPLTAYAR